MRSISIPAPIRYTVKGLALLAASERPLDIPRIAKKLKLPAAALAKSFQLLARRGLVEGRRGPGGGYRLAREAGAITLSEIAGALAPQLQLQPRRCLLEDHACRPASPCALHEAAVQAARLLERRLQTLTVADFAVPKEANPPERGPSR